MEATRQFLVICIIAVHIVLGNAMSVKTENCRLSTLECKNGGTCKNGRTCECPEDVYGVNCGTKRADVKCDEHDATFTFNIFQKDAADWTITVNGTNSDSKCKLYSELKAPFVRYTLTTSLKLDPSNDCIDFIKKDMRTYTMAFKFQKVDEKDHSEIEELKCIVAI